MSYLVEDDQTECGDWTLFGSSCYSIKDAGKNVTWSEAREFCVSREGQLADIHSPEEQAFIHRLYLRKKLTNPIKLHFGKYYIILYFLNIQKMNIL